jgi:putative membrane protein
MAATRHLRDAAAQLARGFVMGAADVVPGVSGGTVALVFGIYPRLIETIRSASRALGRLARGDVRGAWSRLVRTDWLFLLPLLAGILVAVVSLASVIERQLEDNPEEMAGLFFGLIAGSTVVAWRLLRSRTPARLSLMVLVAVLVFVALGWRAGPVVDPSPLAFFGAGAVAICAMILPGISGSFLLLMLGMYGAVINTVDDRLVGDAAVFVLGAIIGLALFSTLLGQLLDAAFDSVMAILIGLMLGSLRVLWPWPHGVGVISEVENEVVSGTDLHWPSADEWFGPTALAVIAFTGVLAFSSYADRRIGG